MTLVKDASLKEWLAIVAQHEFTIKGVKIMAASNKDAIKKFNHPANDINR